MKRIIVEMIVDDEKEQKVIDCLLKNGIKHAMYSFDVGLGISGEVDEE